ALPARDGSGAARLTDFDEILAGELDCGLIPFGTRGAEPGASQSARFILQDDLGEVFGRLIGEGAGVSVRHLRRLATDRLRHAAIAVPQACHCGTTGCVDDPFAVGLDQMDAFAANGNGRQRAGAVQNLGHRAGTVLLGPEEAKTPAIMPASDAKRAARPPAPAAATTPAKPAGFRYSRTRRPAGRRIRLRPDRPGSASP